MNKRHAVMATVIGLMLLTMTGCCGGRSASVLAAALPDEEAYRPAQTAPAPASAKTPATTTAAKRLVRK
jgi:hypothetical protein